MPVLGSDPSSPNKPGWYPHRYGVEGMQSYWDGSAWTGQSRPKSRGPSLRAIGTGMGAVALLVAWRLLASIFLGGGLALGECFDNSDPQSTAIEAVSCDIPHDNEVVCVVPVRAGFGSDLTPTLDALADAEQCDDIFEVLRRSELPLDVDTLVPTDAGIEAGHDDIIFFVFRSDGRKLNEPVMVSDA